MKRNNKKFGPIKGDEEVFTNVAHWRKAMCNECNRVSHKEEGLLTPEDLRGSLDLEASRAFEPECDVGPHPGEDVSGESLDSGIQGAAEVRRERFTGHLVIQGKSMEWMRVPPQLPKCQQLGSSCTM